MSISYNIKSLTIALLMFLALGAFLVLSPAAYAAEKISIPDLTGVVAFSHAANYMSLEGFVIYRCRARYGVELSRAEARNLMMGKEMGFAPEQTGIAENKEPKKSSVSKKDRYAPARHGNLYSH